jgi:hypothetical protein
LKPCLLFGLAYLNILFYLDDVESARALLDIDRLHRSHIDPDFVHGTIKFVNTKSAIARLASSVPCGTAQDYQALQDAYLNHIIGIRAVNGRHGARATRHVYSEPKGAFGHCLSAFATIEETSANLHQHIVARCGLDSRYVELIATTPPLHDAFFRMLDSHNCGELDIKWHAQNLLLRVNKVTRPFLPGIQPEPDTSVGYHDRCNATGQRVLIHSHNSRCHDTKNPLFDTRCLSYHPKFPHTSSCFVRVSEDGKVTVVDRDNPLEATPAVEDRGVLSAPISPPLILVELRRANIDAVEFLQQLSTDAESEKVVETCFYT